MSSTDKHSKHIGGPPPRDGLTGMSLATKRHFVKVKERMEGYIAETDQEEFQRHDLNQMENHRGGRFHLGLFDAQQPMKSLDSKQESTSSQKHEHHLEKRHEHHSDKKHERHSDKTHEHHSDKRHERHSDERHEKHAETGFRTAQLLRNNEKRTGSLTPKSVHRTS